MKLKIVFPGKIELSDHKLSAYVVFVGLFTTSRKY